MDFTDRVSLGGNVRKTSKGYLIATPRVARVGIQMYTGDEVGKPEMDMVRVYRPEEEVFASDAFKSLANQDITNEHPEEFVDADNWKEVAVGHSGEQVIREGEYVRVPLVVQDKDAILDIDEGKNELSVGYTADLDFTRGTTPQGENYDAIQRNIRANHIALVRRARGGRALRVGDTETRRPTMSEPNKLQRTITVDGVALAMEDMTASIVQRALDAAAKSIEELNKEKEAMKKKREQESADHATAIAKHTTDIATKDAEIATLKKAVEDSKVTPQQLDALVTERVDIIGKAKGILGDALVISGKTNGDIRRQVVDSKLGDKSKGWNDDQVAASFNTLIESLGISGGNSGTTVNDVANAFSARPTNQQTTDAAYAEYEKNLSNAWKNPGKAA